jgi:Phosphodiester glycosidase
MTNQAKGAQRRGSRVAIPVALVLATAAVVFGSVTLARAEPDLAGRAVEAVRRVVGPAPVAAVENVVYEATDWLNRTRYQLTGSAPTWQWTDAPAAAAPSERETAPADQVVLTSPVVPNGIPTPAPLPDDPSSATVAELLSAENREGFAEPVEGSRLVDARRQAGHEAVAQRTLRATPAPIAVLEPPPISPVITRTALAGEGVWRPLRTLGQPVNEPPILWQTVFRPDPERPFAQVGLVAMDLNRSQLHIVVGTHEPVSDAPSRGLRTGVIPAAAQANGKLLAAWNGGFRATHGHYGMMTDGVTWLPPLDGMMTIAVDADGRATMGAWGRGIKLVDGWTAWRQNNPPLIEDGKVSPDVVKYANTIRWGASIDGAVFIWRSGMGITADGRWLIYAAGNSLSAKTLTVALQAAGARDAMQLDVNATWERFVTFSDKSQAVQTGGKDVSLPATAVKLIDQMAGGPTQFLVPWERDFFYLTYRAADGGPPQDRKAPVD